MNIKIFLTTAVSLLAMDEYDAHHEDSVYQYDLRLAEEMRWGVDLWRRHRGNKASALVEAQKKYPLIRDLIEKTGIKISCIKYGTASKTEYLFVPMRGKSKLPCNSAQGASQGSK